MANKENAQRVTVTLPPEMLSSFKAEVSEGHYGSVSEVVREAGRLWQQRKDEREARLELIRARLEKSAQSGKPIPMDDVFGQIEEKHKKNMGQNSDESV